MNRRIINTDENENPVSVGINLGLEEEINLFTGSILIKKDIFMDLLRYSIEKITLQMYLMLYSNIQRKKSIGLYKSKESLSVIMDTLTYFEASFNLLDRDFLMKFSMNKEWFIQKAKTNLQLNI